MSVVLLLVVFVVSLIGFIIFDKSRRAPLVRSIGPIRTRNAIGDNFKTVEEVSEALRQAGLESSNLVIGIDYTKSNEHNGRRTFGGKCLHTIDHESNKLNPYERVINVIGRTLEPFDDDKLIHVFGFGDSATTNRTCVFYLVYQLLTFLASVFPFYADRLCYRFTEVHERYREITPLLTLSGTYYAALFYVVYCFMLLAYAAALSLFGC